MLEKICIRIRLHTIHVNTATLRLESKTEVSFYTLESPNPLNRIRILRKKTRLSYKTGYITISI